MTSQIKEKVLKFMKILHLPTDVLAINEQYDIVGDYQKKKAWGSAYNSGVYIFLAADERILYIGSSVVLGKRLGQYFQYAIDGSGKSVSPNSKDVKWVITIGLNDKYWFLAPALEYFLISELNPKRNKNIKNR